MRFFLGVVFFLMMAVESFAAPLLYVSNEGGDSISVIATQLSENELEANEVVRTQPICRGPRKMALSQDGGLLYVACLRSNEVAVVDLIDGGTRSGIEIEGRPISLALSPDGGTLLVVSWMSGQLSFYDLKHEKVRAVVGLGSKPIDILISPDGEWAAVSRSTEPLLIVDMKNRLVVAEVEGTAGGQGMAVSDEGDYLYLANDSEKSLQVVSMPEGRMIKQVHIGDGPKDVVLNPAGHLAYVSDTAGRLAVVDLEENKVIAEVELPEKTRGLALSDDGRYVFIAGYEKSTLSVVNLQTLKVVDGVRVGESPSHVLMAP